MVEIFAKRDPLLEALQKSNCSQTDSGMLQFMFEMLLEIIFQALIEGLVFVFRKVNGS